MPNYAIYNDNIVVNVIVANSIENIDPSIGNAIETDGEPWIGWTLEEDGWRPPSPHRGWIWDGKDWIPPIPKPESTQEGQAFIWNDQNENWQEIFIENPEPNNPNMQWNFEHQRWILLLPSND